MTAGFLLQGMGQGGGHWQRDTEQEDIMYWWASRQAGQAGGAPE